MSKIEKNFPESNAILRASLHSYVHTTHHATRNSRYKAYFKKAVAHGTAGAGGPWNVPALCEAYNWPQGLLGGGVIAIVELGGGWVQSDMDAFFGSIGQPSPQITDVSVDGTENTPDPDPNGPDGEVALDIQVAGAAYYVATGTVATIRVYFTQDIASGVRAAAADGCDVCSISWGADEAKWGRARADDMEQAAIEATNAGMIVFAASGDNDSRDGGPHPANVDCPSSCPHVVGCGGTKKTETSETVWNNDPGETRGEGTGGGYSRLFPIDHEVQVGVAGAKRLVPDVAANADPNTGYNIVVHGSAVTIGGTSAVAPLYAGLFASFGEKLGFISPVLYRNPVCFNDITEGDNGAFRAKPGVDACTGLGSPNGTALASLFVKPVAMAASKRIAELEEQIKHLRGGGR